LRSDGKRAIYAFSSEGRISEALRANLAALGDVAIDGQPIAGDPTLRLHVAGHALRCSPLAFYQVNLEINEELGAFVRQAITDLRSERLLELYAGIGNLSVPLAANGLPVVAVEREGASTADLRATLAERSLPIRVVTSAAEAFDPSTEAFDVALLDPPRAGAPGVIPKILRNRPRGIVYVACHVPSAARDLKPAFDAGYRLADVRCFDMFPGSHHFETVAVVVRGK
jgi:23S rRNA (uracil1939-C5)-methyltransferase